MQVNRSIGCIACYCVSLPIGESALNQSLWCWTETIFRWMCGFHTAELTAVSVIYVKVIRCNSNTDVQPFRWRRIHCVNCNMIRLKKLIELEKLSPPVYNWLKFWSLKFKVWIAFDRFKRTKGKLIFFFMISGLYKHLLDLVCCSFCWVAKTFGICFSRLKRTCLSKMFSVEWG